ncbi:hypothetical protein [Enterococcus faecalis]|nr:hypothetical protein [Enterococcus faecalis]
MIVQALSLGIKNKKGDVGMRKKKEQRYFMNELENELIDFLHKKHKKCIALETYINKTNTVYHWTYERKVALYKAVHESDTLVLGYERSNKDNPMELFTSVQVA